MKNVMSKLIKRKMDISSQRRLLLFWRRARSKM